ncbi:MAG TPA: TetR/AcrR family transcriptional regulator [Halioglobus sp.]
MSKKITRKATRGNPLLSQELITQTAMGLLQNMPLRQLTMRRLAEELGTTAAAVYGYFGSQDDLFDAIMNQVMDGIDLSRLARNTDWRAILREWAHAVRRRHKELPYGVEIMQVRAQVPTRWLELGVPMVGALRSAGLEGAALFNTVVMFQGVVSGLLLNEFSLATAQPDSRQGAAAAILADLSEPARQVWKPLASQLRKRDNDTLFDLTIDCVISGIEATLAAGKV